LDASLTSYRQQSTTDSSISIKTAEGDIVTISRHSLQDVRGMVYDQRGRVDGSELAIHGERSHERNESSTEIQVQGDLNDAEMEDIRKVMAALDQAGQEANAGDQTPDALKDLLAGGGLDTIGSLTASFQHTVRTSAEYRALHIATPQETAGPADSPDEQPESRDPVRRFKPLRLRLLEQTRSGQADQNEEPAA
jgi:hypothetical protein